MTHLLRELIKGFLAFFVPLYGGSLTHFKGSVVNGKQAGERAGLLGSHKTSEQPFCVTESGIHIVSMFGSH